MSDPGRNKSGPDPLPQSRLSVETGAGKTRHARYTVIRDTREQKGHGWLFAESDMCHGTVVETLHTGDYTLRGYEHIICVERKTDVNEFKNNVCGKRFWRELERMRAFPIAALILEFTMADILGWPANSGLPKSLRERIRVSGKFIASNVGRIRSEYPNIRVILAGVDGKQEAVSLFEEALNVHA